MDGKLPPPKTDADGNVLPADEGWFSFESKASIFTDYILQAQQLSGPKEANPVPSETPGASGMSHADFFIRRQHYSEW